MSMNIQTPSPAREELGFTFSYKHLETTSLRVDVRLRLVDPRSVGPVGVPAVLYFHGGGLTVGNRQSWFPHWLKERVLAAGFAFLSADYRLMPPANGHDIVDDIQDLFRFISSELNPLLKSGLPTKGIQDDASFEINTRAIAVAGCSAGGLCAYLAVMHASPRPVALLGLYAMGGNFLTPHYFNPKAEVFFRGREILDPRLFSSYLHPSSQELEVTGDSALSYCPDTSTTPGYPSNPRMLLARLYLQLGIFLDYYTGRHEPSLSLALRNSTPSPAGLEQLIPVEHHALFPQFGVSRHWPPVFLVHGAQDSAVPVVESKYIHDLLKQEGIDVTLRVMEGMEHSFDYAATAEETFGGEGGLFEEAMSFLAQHLG